MKYLIYYKRLWRHEEKRRNPSLKDKLATPLNSDT